MISDPFVHHNSLSTACKPRAYHPSSQSVFPPGQGQSNHMDIYGDMVGRGGLTHANTIYPDSMPSPEPQHLCCDCTRRRERELQPPPPCDCARHHGGYRERSSERGWRDYEGSDIGRLASGRNRSSSRSEEHDVYRRPSTVRRSSRGRQDTPMSRTETRAQSHYDDLDRSEKPQSRNREFSRGRQSGSDRLNPAEELDMSSLRLDGNTRSTSRGHEERHRPRSREPIQAGYARGDHLNASGPSQRGLNLADVAETQGHIPNTEEVYPLPQHDASPSRQHRMVYKGHKPAEIGSYSKYRRDPAKPRGYGRD